VHACPCGFFSDSTRECRCTGAIIQRYLSKISGPLLDRIDLHVEVPAVPYKELRGKDHGVSSAEMRQRVEAARAIQQQRGFYKRAFRRRNCENAVHWTARIDPGVLPLRGPGQD
jgi:magnesium chelatase family protein